MLATEGDRHRVHLPPPDKIGCCNRYQNNKKNLRHHLNCIRRLNKYHEEDNRRGRPSNGWRDDSGHCRAIQLPSCPGLYLDCNKSHIQRVRRLPEPRAGVDLRGSRPNCMPFSGRLGSRGRSAPCDLDRPYENSGRQTPRACQAELLVARERRIGIGPAWQAICRAKIASGPALVLASALLAG